MKELARRISIGFSAAIGAASFVLFFSIIFNDLDPETNRRVLFVCLIGFVVSLVILMVTPKFDDHEE